MLLDNINVGIYTLGCKVNQYESEAIVEELVALGATVLPHEQKCDVYVINTCTVTAESDRKARQFIRRAISKNPDAYILICGCLAQVAPEQIGSIDGVDYVSGNTNKLSVARAALRLVAEGKKPDSPVIEVGDIKKAEFEKMSISRFDRTRAYVKIEDGCENKCSYCIIPSARGPVRSKSPLDVLREVEHLTRTGCSEIVLTGIETASYGRDLGDTDLSELLCAVNSIEGIGRVRLGSLDPSLITERFADRISTLSSIAPHFHLSLQSGSDRVLALMRRKYNSKMAMRAIELLRERIPSVQFTTDVIVGFPGETEEDFEQTLSFAKQAGFLKIHIFPYSKRNGTPAAEMPGQLTKEIKSNRLARLSQIESAARLDILHREIRERPIQDVLFETFEDGVAKGHTANFIEVCVKADAPRRSELCRVRLIKTDGEVCYGELCEE